MDTKFLKRRFLIGNKRAAALATCFVLAVVLLVSRFPRALSQLSMNLATIHLVRSGIGLTWPMLWHWNADGQLSLNGGPKEAISVLPRSSQEAAQALKYSLRAIALWPDNILSQRTLAYLAFAGGDYAGLQENLSTLSKKDAQRPWDVLALVKLYEWRGDHRLAVEELRRSGAVDPLLSIVERTFSDGQIENMQRLAPLAVEAYLDSPEAYYKLGHILALAGSGPEDAEYAIDIFNKGLQLQPANTDMRIGLAHALIEAGRYQDALPQLFIAFQRAPDNSVVHLLLGEVYLNQGDLTMAISEYKITLDLAPDQAWALYGLGRAYALQGKMDDAVSAWQLALKADPNFEPALNALSGQK